MRRAVALLFATVLVFAALAQAILTNFVLIYCDTNCEPGGHPRDLVYWLLFGPALAVVFTALAFWVFVAFNSPRLATRTFVLQAVVVSGLLVVWLAADNDSNGSFGVAVAGFTVGAEACGLIALHICRTEANERGLAAPA